VLLKALQSLSQCLPLFAPYCVSMSNLLNYSSIVTDAVNHFLRF
jgi:hypothetical protein